MQTTIRLAVVSLILIAGLVPAGHAAGELTLEEAMAQAREQAFEVNAARMRMAASEARLREARSYRKPEFRLEEIWTRTDSPADAFGLILNQERFSLAEFSAGNPNDPDPIENALTRLEMKLPVYTGGELGGRIRQAELGVAAAGQQAGRVGDLAALAGAEAFIRLTQAREHVALIRRALEAVGAHVELARAYVEEGVLVRSELLRAEVESSRIQELLIEARGRERVAIANLGFRLGSPDLRGLTLVSLGDPLPLTRPLESWLATTAGRADLAAARNRLAAGRLEESIHRSRRKPKLGLLARHDRFDDSLFGASGQSSSVVALASIDLFSGGRHEAAAVSARAEADAAEFDIERLREGIRLEVRDAYERTSSALERQATSRLAVAAAREVERITGERFENGVAKTLDVVDALNARREAETRELLARAESHLAVLRLAVAAGQRPESVLPGKADRPAGQ